MKGAYGRPFLKGSEQGSGRHSSGFPSSAPLAFKTQNPGLWGAFQQDFQPSCSAKSSPIDMTIGGGGPQQWGLSPVKSKPAERRGKNTSG